MRFASALPALLVGVSSAVAAAATAASSASSFVPPATFQNVNLVRIISAEKNYVKETVNVLVENIASSPQDEYYLAIPSDKFPHVGGVEVKDRKDPDVGPFVVEPVEAGPESETQYLRIRLPKALEPGAQQTLGITYYVLRAYRPLPAQITQDDKQYLVYGFTARVPSAYATAKQKTEVKFSTGDVPDYTPAGSGEGEGGKVQKQGSRVTYGPFEDAQAAQTPLQALLPVEVRFEFTKPVSHVARLERDVEVSHWGGNVAFEERYTLLNRGANLSTLFSRAKWAQAQYYNPPSPALRGLTFPLAPGSADAYYTDVVGNVSTSRFRSGPREALLEVKPRYPVFGGWKFPFTVGWNLDAKAVLRRLPGRAYVLNVPFLEGPRHQEGIEYEQVRLQILLPEGAENVRYSTTIPPSSIAAADVTLHKTFLDTVGRTAIVIEACNLVDDFRGREVVVAYDYSLLASLRKPVVVFASVLGLFVAAYAVGTVELKFSK